MKKCFKCGVDIYEILECEKWEDRIKYYDGKQFCNDCYLKLEGKNQCSICGVKSVSQPYYRVKNTTYCYDCLTSKMVKDGLIERETGTYYYFNGECIGEEGDISAEDLFYLVYGDDVEDVEDI